LTYFKNELRAGIALARLLAHKFMESPAHYAFRLLLHVSEEVPKNNLPAQSTNGYFSTQNS
jgi:hypothetical protein